MLSKKTYRPLSIQFVTDRVVTKNVVGKGFSLQAASEELLRSNK